MGHWDNRIMGKAEQKGSETMGRGKAEGQLDNATVVTWDQNQAVWQWDRIYCSFLTQDDTLFKERGRLKTCRWVPIGAMAQQI